MPTTDDLYLDHDTTVEDLTAQLPSFMPKDENSGNYALYSTLAERISALEADIEALDKATNVQTAESIAQLRRLATLVDLKPTTGESLEHYRARVIAEFQLVTSEGTVMDLLNAAALILETDTSKLQYAENHATTGGHCQLKIPQSRLDSLAFTESEFATVLDAVIASSYSVSLLTTGTFTYLSPADYTGGSTYDSAALNSEPTLGHDGLDTNGDPKHNGGTYSGLLE